jgi:BlaI family transcriptional regulator, penicillinase repressor
LGVRAPPGPPFGFQHQRTLISLSRAEIPSVEIRGGAGLSTRVECKRYLPVNRIFHFRASSSQLGPLEERLLEALWRRGDGTVREVVDDGCQDLAYTTVMTTLDRLFKKNLLSREAEGRAFRYRARFTREELHREVAGEAFRQLLDACPSSSLPLSYLVEVLTERDGQLLDDLRKVVEAKRRQLRSNGDQSKTKDKA